MLKEKKIDIIYASYGDGCKRSSKNSVCNEIMRSIDFKEFEQELEKLLSERKTSKKSSEDISREVVKRVIDKIPFIAKE